MQVKIFESPDMATGLRMIRKELGPDALILSTRTIRSGKLGLLGRPMMEITAAVDHKPSSTSERSKLDKQQPANVPAAHQRYLQHSTSQPVKVKTEELSPDNIQNLIRKRLNTVDSPSVQPSSQPHGDVSTGMLSELDELKGLVKTLAGEVAQLRPQAGATGPISLVESAPDVVAHTTQDWVMKLLRDRGIGAETAATIRDFARQSLSPAELMDTKTTTRFLQKAISPLVNAAPPSFTQSGAQTRVALVGATGVGKTTTLAKIAASYLNRHSNSIALITIDTYRIAAVEQLKVYGEIMRLPVEVVVTASQLEAALNKYHDKELILIDTAGRSPRDSVCIEELASFLKPELAIETHLVLSAVTREQELLETIERFNPLSVDRTIFTKIDECSSCGILLNTQIRNPSPLSYITNGQRVPEDLLELDSETVARLIIPFNEG